MLTDLIAGSSLSSLTPGGSTISASTRQGFIKHGRKASTRKNFSKRMSIEIDRNCLAGRSWSEQWKSDWMDITPAWILFALIKNRAQSSCWVPRHPLERANHILPRCNRPRSIYQYSNMAPRLSGQTSIFGVVFFVSKSLLGIEKQKKLEKFAILTRKPRSHVRILIYRTWSIAKYFRPPCARKNLWYPG